MASYPTTTLSPTTTRRVGELWVFLWHFLWLRLFPSNNNHRPLPNSEIEVLFLDLPSPKPPHPVIPHPSPQPSSSPNKLNKHTMAQKMNPNPLELKSSPPTVIRQIQGPKPPPLRVSKDSHYIKKSSPRRPPVNIYQTSVSNFKSMVRSVTGYSSASYSGDGHFLPGARLASTVKTNPSKIDRDRANSTNTTTAMLKEENVGFVEIFRLASTHPGSPEPSTLPPIPDGFFSPAATLASIVKASPSKRDRDRANSNNTTTAMLEEEVVEILSNASTHPGVLSPSPSTLLPVTDGVFSPVIEPQSYLVKHELSPLWHNAFMASTSGLFSAPLISPSPSCTDLFNLFYAYLNAKTEISEELIKNGGDLAEQQPRRSLFPGIGYSRLTNIFAFCSFFIL